VEPDNGCSAGRDFKHLFVAVKVPVDCREGKQGLYGLSGLLELGGLTVELEALHQQFFGTLAEILQ
jgi:hypothetical protein